eukprot:Tbor_TRINITY_DN5865_c0_g1::TRINITY_DN5865_c0_g1_i1::g.6101::m.6101
MSSPLHHYTDSHLDATDTPGGRLRHAGSNSRSSASPKKGSGFSEKEVKYFKKMFDLFDTDHSGAIGFYEMKNMCRHLGVELSDDKLKQSMEDIDENGSGEMEFEEFLMWLADIGSGKSPSTSVLDGTNGSTSSDGVSDQWALLKSKIRAQGAKPLSNRQIEEFREVFNHFDTDGSGTIDTEELLVVFEAMGQTDVTDEEIQELMATVDDDRSGEIDFDEFLLLMCTGYNKSQSGSGIDGEEADSVEEMLLNAFHSKDPTRCGLISTEGLKEVMKAFTKDEITDAELDEIASLVEKDRGDGFIEYMRWDGLWEACHE